MKFTTLSLLAMSLPLLSACVVDDPYDRGGYYPPHNVSVHVDDRDDWDHGDDDKWDKR